MGKNTQGPGKGTEQEPEQDLENQAGEGLEMEPGQGWGKVKGDLAGWVLAR